MYKNIPTTIVERRRRIYTPGTRVQLDHMEDPYTRMTPGDKGTVTHVDDTATIHVQWDNGSSLGLLYGIDFFHVIKEDKSEN